MTTLDRLETTAANGGNRYLLTVAINDYHDDDTAYTDSVKRQLAAVRAFFACPDLGTRAISPPQPTATLRSRADLDAYIHTVGLRRLAENDVLVLYIAGHGLEGASTGAVALFDRETCPAWPGGGGQIAVASSANAAATRCRAGVSVAIS
ncbi:hypothetical protein [Actinoplanes derwentensis]|uniref:Caspase domain-containing protein n=1 Tax=Actinoplanes derwentensis TaxID=113562 RepID=A0A1H2CVR4_9ACTN|nr:hypothetical protein [Actinoplanes derwentensis]GID90227.1 hypothetical protein Ade03nite_91510 [Actinoplanes derwentensis]SDT74585.1 hypothetical protein SAMN04489716_7027 [Actinoplanes derwentensis]